MLAIRVIAALLLVATVAAGERAAAQAARLLLVDIDDAGVELVRDTPTPTLDYLATRGRYFTGFTTSPKCAPTRALVMTGAYGSHPDLLIGENFLPLSPETLPLAPLVLLPRLLAQAGVRAEKFGKWHLCGEARPLHPNDAGFDHYSGVLGNLGPVQAGYYNYPKTVDGTTSQVQGSYLTIDETDDAIDAVRREVDFVSLSYHAVHAPWQLPPAHLYSIPSPSTPRDRARAVLEALDRELGRLLREALERGYTVLVFSDNGSPPQLGGRKGTVYEGGIRTDLWAIGKGVMPGVDATRLGAVDLYATVADFFGLSTGGPHCGPHSQTFLPELGGRAGARRWAYSESFRPNGINPRLGFSTWIRAVRGERWKLVRLASGDEFFDLLNDPHERRDLLLAPSLPPEAQPALDHFRLVLDRL